MKWNKTSVLVVLAVLLGSFFYTSIKDKSLSDEVLESKLKDCTEQANYDCQLIHKYHDDCFSSSYRAELRIKQFRHAEYDACLDNAIQEHIRPGKN